MTDDQDRFLRTAKRVFVCIARNRAAEMNTFNLRTALNDELGLDGDDVDALFADVQQYYKIQWDDFPFQEYFSSEGLNPVHLLLWLLFLPVIIFVAIASPSFPRIGQAWNGFLHGVLRIRIKQPFTVGDLVWSAYLGKWSPFPLETTMPILQELNAWQNKFAHLRRLRKKKRRHRA